MTEVNPLGKNIQNKPAVSEKHTAKPQLKESLFLKLDKNKDGKISYQNFMRADIREMICWQCLRYCFLQSVTSTNGL